MDRVLNSKDEKQTIYEIYRACRLCGAGAGYKMPIIQNVVNLEGEGVELRQKIKDCVQIEVNHTDRMPPLICELCVDKVNDFYEFFDMCKQNNKRTRLRLGLPLHTPTRDSTESDNCILGVTEPVFIDSNTEALKSKSKKNKVKKEPVEVKIKVESRPSPKPQQTKQTEPEEVQWAVMSRGRLAPGNTGSRRATRQSIEPVVTPPTDVLELERKLKRARENEMKIDTPPPSKKAKTIPEPLKIVNKPKTALKEAPKPTPKAQPKPASKKDTKFTPKPSKTSPSKALPNIQPSKVLPTKVLPTKVLPSKVLPNKVLLPKVLPTKVLPKSKSLKVPPEAPKTLTCLICNMQIKNIQGLNQHHNKHVPAFTSPKHACNACELWFSTTEEAASHHKHHRTQNVPYKCTRCYGYFKLQLAYEEHFGLGQCLSEWEVPDVQCPSCWRTFPTGRLLDGHRCAGADARPGGKCEKCKRSYALLKNLVKHESTCSRRKDETTQNLLPMQVRIVRCDPLLSAGTPVYCGALPQNYGLDRSRKYPYFRPRVKEEQPMVSIDESVKHEFSKHHIESLSTLCLRIIQKKRLKSEPCDQFDDISAKINSIIDHLGNEDSQSCSSDSILNESKKVGEAKKANEGKVEDKSSIESETKESFDSKEVEPSISEVKEIDKGLSVGEIENVGLNNITGLDIVTNGSDANNGVENESKEKEVEVSDEDRVAVSEKDKNNGKELEVSGKDEKEIEISEKDKESEVSGKVEKLEGLEKNENSKNVNVDSNIESKSENEFVNNDNHEVDENMETNKDSDETNKVENNENFSKIDEITNKILETQEFNASKDSQDNFTDETNKYLENQDTSISKSPQDLVSEQNSDPIQENGVDSQDKFNVNDLSEDDRKLMAELDEQIGENEEKVCESHENEQISENDNLKRDNDNQISDNGAQIGVDDNKVTENDMQVNENDNQIGENDNKVTENDMQVCENENKVTENDKQVGENDNPSIDNMQIGMNDNKITDSTIENRQKSKNHYIDELLKKQDSDMRSLDLDSISDDEFNFDL